MPSSSPSFSTAPPPSYFDPTKSIDVPAYSTLPSRCEHILIPDSEHGQVAPSHATRHVYDTRHMHVDLGPRLCSSQIPAYGFGAVVVGCITIRGRLSHVERISVRLEGHLTVDTASQNYEVPLISVPADVGQSPSCAKKLFSIPIPRFQADGAKLPPTSSLTVTSRYKCSTRYMLRIDMIRKGWRFNESLALHILYLPKTSPIHLPMTIDDLARPILIDRVPFSSPEAGVKTATLAPYYKPGPTTTNAITIHLSLPSYRGCFVSGGTVPFILTIAGDAAAVTSDTLKAVPPNITVTMYRRTRLHAAKGSDANVTSDTPIGHAARMLVHTSSAVNDDDDTICMTLRGGIAAGESGKECSWKVEGAAEVSCFIRAEMRSPPNLQHLITDVRHDEPCRLTTEMFGIPQRELLATGGIPVPALGINRRFSGARR